MGSFKDRKDGKRLGRLNGMSYIMYHLKKSRNASEVYMDKAMDVTELVKYFNKLKKKDDVHVTYFHLFSTAVAKTIYNRPYLNRFIVNGYYYERNDVLLSYVAKTSFTDDAQEVMQVIKALPDDNIFTLSEKMSKVVKSARGDNKTSSTDDLVDNIGNLPKILRSSIVGVFKFLDRHDFLPISMTSEILYYSTVILSNLGSIGSKEAIHHNLTDFGTNSILITMGKIYKKEIINDKGEKEVRDFCDFGLTLDERIADGFYMIKSIELLEYILKNPKLLEGKCSDEIKVK